jgi:hypothetical protein
MPTNPHNRQRSKFIDVRTLAINGVEYTGTAADLNQGAGMATSSARPKRYAVVALAALDTAGGCFSWQNPEAVAVIVNRVTIDVTTKSTAAGTLSVGMTAVSGTTSAANLIDTLDVGTAAGTFDNIQNAGTLGKPLQKVAVGKWVTGSKATGALAGLVGNAIIEYSLAS